MQWDKLKKLRDTFLREKPGADYWTENTLLDQYDQTFAQRIKWKWISVLNHTQQSLKKPIEVVLDWGCGTGIAARCFLKTKKVDAVFLYDRSPRAMQFAKNAIQSEWPTQKVSFGIPPARFTLLLSHVLNELTTKEKITVLELCRNSENIFWVEPGTKECSNKLIEIREALRQSFTVLAPCTHQSACALQNPQKDWCHQFAKPPAEVFQSKHWSDFSKELRIDLRSLPVSYLVLSRSVPATSASSLSVEIGRARKHKGYLTTLLCNESGVHSHRLLKKENPEKFKEWSQDTFSRTDLPFTPKS